MRYVLILLVLFMSEIYDLHAKRLDKPTTTNIENYVRSFVVEVNGSIVKLHDRTVYKERDNQSAALHVGDEIHRIRCMTVWEGMSYRLYTDKGISMWGVLQVQSIPYMHQIVAMNTVKKGIEVTLEDASTWIIKNPDNTDPMGEWWTMPNWKIGDFVLISIWSQGYIMDNLSDFSSAEIL